MLLDLHTGFSVGRLRWSGIPISYHILNLQLYFYGHLFTSNNSYLIILCGFTESTPICISVAPKFVSLAWPLWDFNQVSMWVLFQMKYFFMLKRIPVGICHLTQAAQLSTPWQPRGMGWGGRWEAGSRGRGHMYTCDWFMLIYSRNQNKVAKQLSSNKFFFKRKEFLAWLFIHISRGHGSPFKYKQELPTLCSHWRPQSRLTC